MTSTVSIGGRDIHQLGFGAMRLTGDAPWGPAPAREDASAILHRLVDAGVQLIDTADSYSVGMNEELIADVLHPYADELLIATKAGQSRPSPAEWKPLGRPEYLRQQVELSLIRLRVESLDLFQLHRIDPKVDFDEQIGTLRDLRAEGKVRHVGLSQVSVDQLARARDIVEIVSVQNKYSLSDRRDDDVLDYCTGHGIAFLPWRPLYVAAEDHPQVEAVAEQLGVSVSQVALAWLLQRSLVMLPIPGTANLVHLEANLAARDLRLTSSQVQLLDGVSTTHP